MQRTIPVKSQSDRLFFLILRRNRFNEKDFDAPLYIATL
jgi:hypothetical protein